MQMVIQVSIKVLMIFILQLVELIQVLLLMVMMAQHLLVQQDILKLMDQLVKYNYFIMAHKNLQLNQLELK